MDLNAHYHLLGSNNKNNNVVQIIDMIEEFEWVVLNEKISTRIGTPDTNISPLDLTLV